MDNHRKQKPGKIEKNEKSESRSCRIEVIWKTPNWKAPGLDKFHNFWWKQFTGIHKRLSNSRYNKYAR